MNMQGINKGFEDEEMQVVQNVSRVMDNVTNASAQALDIGGRAVDNNITVNTDNNQLASGIASTSNEQSVLMRQEIAILKQILAKTGMSLDGKQIKKSYDTETRQQGLTILEV